MKRPMRRAALALAAGMAALGTVGTVGIGSASAAPTITAPTVVGTIQEAGKGVPASLKHGQTVYLTMYYRQESRDILVPESFGLGLFNMKAPGQGQLRGISATWWNQVTHRWENAGQYAPEGDLLFSLPNTPRVKVASGTLAHVYVRITFGRAAFAGQWHFIPRVNGYTLLTSKGVQDWANLDETSRKQYTSTLR